MNGTAPPHDLDRALARIEAGEQHARRNIVIASIIPVALAVALIAFTGYWVRRSQTQVSALSTQKQALEVQVGSLEVQNKTLGEQAQSLEAKLRETTELVKFTRQVDFADAKYVASSSPQAARILELALDLKQRNVRWKLGGRSPEEGFDSPGFAAFVLRRLHLLPGAQGGEAAPALHNDPGGWLRNNLKEIPQPRVGDLVFYDSGYAMFYFTKPGAEPFVLGMTPFGITALIPDFAKRFGVRHVPTERP